MDALASVRCPASLGIDHLVQMLEAVSAAHAAVLAGDLAAFDPLAHRRPRRTEFASRLGPDVRYVGEADAEDKRRLYADAAALRFVAQDDLRSQREDVTLVKPTRYAWEESRGRAEVVGRALRYLEAGRVGGVP
jgi:hypothetical protein